METLLQRLLDRYDVEELVAALGLTIEDIYEAFEDRIKEAHDGGVIDT